MATVVSQNGENHYIVDLPVFTDEEERLIDLVTRVALNKIHPTELEALFLKDRSQASLIHEAQSELLPVIGAEAPTSRESKNKAVQAFVSKHLKTAQPSVVAGRLVDLLWAMGPITQLMDDPELEEVMVNGVNKPVFVFHRTAGMCRTNIVFSSEKELQLVVERAAASQGREVTGASPLLDLNLSSGARANITVSPASVNPTITVRKFTANPLSIVDLMASRTLDSRLAGFLWTAVDGFGVSPMNIVFVGGASSGKTTMLNAVAGLINPDKRIISIEDTLELNLGRRDNWVQLESSYDYRTKSRITMDDLVNNALRMRPDRLLVGEVRGREAQSLFTAMDIGCAGSMGTMHANNAREALLRLQSRPMEVPEAMLPLLDLIAVQHRFNWFGKMVRRVTQVSEVSWMGECVLLNDVFLWDRPSNALKRTKVPSQTLEKLAFACGRSKNDVQDEIDLRAAALEWMSQQSLSYDGVVRLVQEFYADRNSFLARL